MYKILIADDEAFTRKVFREVIAKALPNAQVFEASDGDVAWGILQTRAIDLVAIDVNMPVMGGIELVNNIKGNEKTKNIKVIVVSALAAEEISELVTSLGAEAVLSKLDVSIHGSEDNVLVKEVKRLLNDR